jgi:vacuolar protein sorting-associated protein VTA1
VAPAEGSDRLYCENFALTVFSRADRMDRAGRADINTAKCYYAAAIFLQVRVWGGGVGVGVHGGAGALAEGGAGHQLAGAGCPARSFTAHHHITHAPQHAQVLEQFLGKGEEMDVAYPDVVEKARYALWRAAELRKAQREGRPPAPPPEPAEAAAAVAAAAGSSGGGDGGLFAGPAYDASAAGAYSSSGGGAPHQQPQQHAPPAGVCGAAGASLTARRPDCCGLS